MKNRLKTAAAFALLAAVCLAGLILDLSDVSPDVYPDGDTKIMLYGEAHGEKEYYGIEAELWRDCYREGCRDLFVELPFYSAEFLNIWMKEDSDDLLDLWFREIEDTLSGNSDYRAFFREIKESCPETVFYGTDVGHQGGTTGKRYLEFLEEQGLAGSEEYLLAEECVRQGEEFLRSDREGDGISPVREGYLVSNFKDAYARCGGGRIMGIYGSYHTDLSVPDLMAGQLKAAYGETVSSVRLSSIAFGADRQDPYAPGFSVTGLVYLIMLFVPNILWARGRKPAGYEEAAKRENKVLLAFEKAGQVLATVSVLVFPSVDPLVKKLPEGIFFKWRILILAAAFILMILYECCWIRYFRSGRTLKDMYASFAGFPLAGAVLPVTALFLMGISSRNLIVIGSAVILGVGHIGIHYAHSREIGNGGKTEARND